MSCASARSPPVGFIGPAIVSLQGVKDLVMFLLLRELRQTATEHTVNVTNESGRRRRGWGETADSLSPLNSRQ